MPQSSSDPDRNPLVASSSGQDWTDDEVELIVPEYFEMLNLQLAGERFNKAARNRAMQQMIPRSRKAIDFKHCNISSVLEHLGLLTVKGYKGLPHFQNALVDRVEELLATQGAPLIAYAQATPPELAQPVALLINPPPLPSPKKPKETAKLHRLIRKFDPAARDARNRQLGRQGEELVFLHEKLRLDSGGRHDLAQRMEWTARERGDGAGYDIASFELDGRQRLIEVKTTNGPALTPFFLSENERAFSEERPDAFRLFRLYNFIANPAAYELAPPLEEWLTLRSTNYRATLSR